MQMIPQAIAAIGGSTTLSTAATIAGTGAAIAQNSYQARVALNNAKIAEQNAERAINESKIGAQDQDLEAKAQIGALIARGGASGLSLGAGSLALRRKSAEELAARDRGYTIYAGETKADAYNQQAQDYRTEASSLRTANFMEVIGAGFDIGTSLISGAALTNRRNAITGSSPTQSSVSRIAPTRPRARPVSLMQ